MYRRIYIMYTHVGYNICIGHRLYNNIRTTAVATVDRLSSNFAQPFLFEKSRCQKNTLLYTPFWKSLPQTVRSIFERIPLWDIEKKNFTKMLMLIIFVILYTAAQFVSIMYTLHIHKETRVWLDTACCLAWITIYLLP